MAESIRQTQYSHGAGCASKIYPEALDVALAGGGCWEYALEVA
jgi:hypothetical protein